MISLEAAKQHLRDNINKGTDCPCCTQYVRIYNRKFNSVMVRSLIQLYKLGNGSHHVRDIMKGISDTGTNDFSKLRYWGMIQEMKNTNPDKKTSGHWEITDKGKEFINGTLTTVPKYAKIYNGKRIGFSEDRTTIAMALGDKFSFTELMKGI